MDHARVSSAVDHDANVEPAALERQNASIAGAAKIPLRHHTERPRRLEVTAPAGDDHATGPEPGHVATGVDRCRSGPRRVLWRGEDRVLALATPQYTVSSTAASVDT